MSVTHVQGGARSYSWLATTWWGWFVRGNGDGALLRVERVPMAAGAFRMQHVADWLPLLTAAGLEAPHDLVRVGPDCAQDSHPDDSWSCMAGQIGAVYGVEHPDEVARTLEVPTQDASGPYCDRPHTRWRRWPPAALTTEESRLLGLILLRAASGSYASRSGDPSEQDAWLLKRVLELTFLPPELSGLVLRLLDPDPEAHPAADELRETLLGLAVDPLLRERLTRMDAVLAFMGWEDEPAE